MIVLDRVSFGYSTEQEVLSDVSVEIGSGLSLVVGPNGCGKSTLLKLAAGVEIPNRGRISVAGHDLWRDEVAARRHLAYLPEHPDLTPYATVGEILILVCGLRGEPAKAARQALQWAGLKRLERRTVRELSKGQRRRATLAAARIGTPDCLLLDEPLDGMDLAFRGECVSWVVERVGAGATVVVVSHDFGPFTDVVDRVATIRAGRCHMVTALPPPGQARDLFLQRCATGAGPPVDGLVDGS